MWLQLNKELEPQPLLVAAGGGGLARTSQKEETKVCHGHGVNVSRQAITGEAYGDQAAGKLSLSLFLLLLFNYFSPSHFGIQF